MKAGWLVAIALGISLEQAETLAQGEQRDYPPQNTELVTEFLRALRQPGTEPFHLARHELQFQPEKWKTSLRSFLESGAGSPREQAEVVECLTAYRDRELQLVYRGRLKRALARAPDDRNAQREVRDLTEALVFAGQEADTAIVVEALAWQLTPPDGAKVIEITGKNYWSLALSAIAAAEAGLRDSEDILAGLREAIAANIEGRASLDPRYEDMAAYYHAAVFFAVEYAERRHRGLPPLTACLDIFDKSSEYRVRVAAMNLARELIDEERSGVERQAPLFPLTSKWELEEALETYRFVLSHIGPSVFEFRPGSIVLTDGTRPAKRLEGNALAEELVARRREVEALSDKWPARRDRLVEVQSPDVVELLEKKLYGFNLTRDRRIERPVITKPR